jgi:hypothetical protein
MMHTIRIYLALLCLPILAVAQPGGGLQLIDVAQREVRLFNQYKDADTTTRNRVFLDSLFTPYEAFWRGYLGDGNAFLRFVNEQMLPALPAVNARNKQVDGPDLIRRFNEVKTNMTRLSGYAPHGTWYIVYGPAWADMGGIGSLAMFIDLAHGNNTSAEQVMFMFPHEINHQIQTNVNRHHDSTALSRILAEGFAVYMNKVYWKDRYTDARHLGYSEDELRACQTQQATINAFFRANKDATDRETIDKFADRGYKLNATLPGAIGYYIGLQIVERYVAKHGPASWKDLYSLSPKDVLAKSGY